MNNINQMNGLYPIIRRVRRPLLPVDLIPDGQQSGAKPVETSTDAAKQNDSSKAASEAAKDLDSKGA
jgi:hypothetical protein